MKYFTFAQWAISKTAKNNGIDNSVPKEFQSRIEELVNKILDPLREAWGSDIIISSGYRCYELNKLIGGSTTSAHSLAYAADIVPKNGSIKEFSLFVMHWLRDNNIQFDQFIDEHKLDGDWVHVAIRNGSGAQRKQYLLYKSWEEKSKQYTSINPYLYQGFSRDNGSISNISQSTNTNSNNSNTISSTSGSTQTGNTNGLLTGRSAYYNTIDIEAIKLNEIFSKSESGEPIMDSNGNFIIDDSYLVGSAENKSDTIENIDELPEEPFVFDMSSITTEQTEQMSGIQYNEDGSYVVKQSKSIQEILALVQEWWSMVQSLKKIDFKHIQESIKNIKEETENIEESPSINAMVYMKAAFDMYGHAYREGMTCPVCGKKARYLPPGGYCSVECLLKAAKDKSLAFLMAPNDKYAWLQEIVDQLCAVLDLTNLLINSIVLIPDIIRELAQLPQEYKDYVRAKIAEGFADLQELIQKAMVKKNELLQKILRPINFGIIAKPVAMAMQTINAIRNALQVAQEAFNLAFDTVKIIIDKLSTLPTLAPGLVLPAESFAWSLTPRSFISPMPYTCPDAGKIFVVLPGGNGVPIEGLKTLLPSALQDLNMEVIDSIIQELFPPLTPVDYYLEPELFQVRYLFSDQSDLVFQVRQQLEDFLRGGPDYLPKFENLLPIKTYTFGKGTDNEVQIPLPNMGYLWFLLGLLDAWAPHSQSMVGSILNPAI